jgi:hypothetical protein
MEHSYWIGRKRSALAMARDATSAEARLIHYELAGRHSIKAAQCLPFVRPVGTPAGQGERATIRLHDPGSFWSAVMCPARTPSGVRGDPEDDVGESR